MRFILLFEEFTTPIKPKRKSRKKKNDELTEEEMEDTKMFFKQHDVGYEDKSIRRDALLRSM